MRKHHTKSICYGKRRGRFTAPEDPGPRAARAARMGAILALSAAAFVSFAAWEKQVLSARGFKRVGRHSEYAT